MTDVNDGLHPQTRASYNRIEAVNYSLLKHFDRSPAHVREQELRPKEATDAMALGTAIHCAVLEPKKFATKYVVAPTVDGRTKAGKEAMAEFTTASVGKSMIGSEEMEVVRFISESMCETARTLLSSPGRNEFAAVWTDPETGLRCKGIIDRLTTYLGWTVIVDIKTCQNASAWAFKGSVAKYKYHEQAAFYLHGLDCLAPAQRRFLWVAIETERPYGVAVYEPDEETLEEGRKLYRQHLRMYAECKSNNTWPGYADGISPLSLPKWALTWE